MRHIAVERWSRRTSALHRWDARMKVLAAGLLIVAIGVTANTRFSVLAAYAGLLAIGIAISGLPAFGILARAAIVLPFSLVFSALLWLAGDATRAVAIPVKSYLSCMTALLLMASTPLPIVLRAFGAIGAPRALLMVTQFVYRYIFVLFEEAIAMKRARECRGASAGRDASIFNAAAGALAVLFGKAHDRAERIHHAMISRGFNGSIAVLESPALGAGDVVAFGIVGVAIVLTWMML